MKYFFLPLLIILISTPRISYAHLENDDNTVLNKGMKPETKDMISSIQQIINSAFSIAQDPYNRDAIGFAVGSIATHITAIVFSFCKRCSTRNGSVDKKLLRALLHHVAENIPLEPLIEEAIILRKKNQEQEFADIDFFFMQ